jgi:pyridoxal phosphate enzyme (YggS family)
VLLLPVTKGHRAEIIRAVAELGFDAIGENRVGEAERKQAELGRMGMRWHMIGHLQRNKAGRAVELFDAIESVDSIRLARRLQLDAERRALGELAVLVQVNAGGEEQKGGFEPDELVDAVGRILELDRLRVDGLMTMAPYTEDEKVLRQTFIRTRECLERCRREIPDFLGSHLSMGMSNDFEIAVEEGSTELRLGTVLLGERPEV